MDPKAVDDFFQTHMVLPSWLVRAYECGLERLAMGSFTRPTGPGVHGGVLPGFVLQELTILSVILSSLQKAFFLQSREFPLININSTQIYKELPSQAVVALNRTVRLLEDLGGLKWISPAVRGTCKAYPLFQEESWLQDPVKGLSVDLLPSAAGAGVILGTVFGPQEFLKQSLRFSTQGQSLSTQVFEAEPPVVVRRSLWLEMTSLEQALFLRLEKSCVEDSPTANLSGLQVQGVQSLVNSVRAPSRKGNLLKLVQRLLRKLKDQGYLEPIREASYLVFSTQEKGLAIAWNDRESVRRKQAQELFQRWSGERQWTHFLDQHFSAWAKHLGAKPEEMTLIRDVFSRLPEGLHHSIMLRNLPVALDLRLLFAEWALRGRKDHRCPLPQVCEMKHLAQTANKLWSKEQAVTAYQEFHSEFRDPLLVQMLTEEPLATVGSPKTWAYLEELGSWKFFTEAKETESAELVTKKSFQTPTKSAALSDGERRAHVGRKIAQFQATSPKQYRSLIEAYLNSLEGASKEMILGVQQTLQPQMFESHLRSRLVQFVMDHTNQWPEFVNP